MVALGSDHRHPLLVKRALPEASFDGCNMGPAHRLYLPSPKVGMEQPRFVLATVEWDRWVPRRGSLPSSPGLPLSLEDAPSMRHGVAASPAALVNMVAAPRMLGDDSAHLACQAMRVSCMAMPGPHCPIPLPCWPNALPCAGTSMRLPDCLGARPASSGWPAWRLRDATSLL